MLTGASYVVRAKSFQELILLMRKLRISKTSSYLLRISFLVRVGQSKMNGDWYVSTVGFGVLIGNNVGSSAENVDDNDVVVVVDEVAFFFCFVAPLSNSPLDQNFTLCVYIISNSQLRPFSLSLSLSLSLSISHAHNQTLPSAHPFSTSPHMSSLV